MEQRYYGADGRRIRHSERGYASVKYEYDVNGNYISEYYYDVNKEPVMP